MRIVVTISLAPPLLGDMKYVLFTLNEQWHILARVTVIPVITVDTWIIKHLRHI
jgi:hypothetical protein